MNDAVVNALLQVYPQIVPELVLGAAACLLFLGGAFWSNRHAWGTVSLLAIAAAGLALMQTWPTGAAPTPEQVYAAPIFLDQLALVIKVIALVGGAVLVLFSWNEVSDRQAADYHACLLVIVAGVCLTGAANELVTLFLALELISIPTYVILYLPRHDIAAQEAATKYFLLSVFSSAFLLFGFSYLYGLTGTTNLPALLGAMNPEVDYLNRLSPVPPLALVALVMVVAGLGFRITAVPFHFYAPDVYQGAPTPVAALLAFIPKVAGFAALFRVLGFAWAGHSGAGVAFREQMPILLWILSAVTMSLGNVLALLQTNIKRLLAYSSVAHAGYMLIGLAAAQNLAETSPSVPGGVQAVLFYLVAYGAMTIGAFAVLAYLSTPQRPVETEDDLTGLAGSHLGVALLMALFLFSLIGIPLTAGFIGKLLLFLEATAKELAEAAAAAQVGRDRVALFRWLLIIGALNAAIGAWYYLRIVVKMFLHSAIRPLPRVQGGFAGLATLTVCAVLTLFLGVYPDALMRVIARTSGSPPPALEARAER